MNPNAATRGAATARPHATVAPTRGLYVGSTLAPHWLDRITVGDLGYRSKAEITAMVEGAR